MNTLTIPSGKYQQAAKLLEELEARVDITTPIGRIYLAARLYEYDTALKKAQEEIKFEKAVNARVREVFAGMLGELDDRLRK